MCMTRGHIFWCHTFWGEGLVWVRVVWARGVVGLVWARGVVGLVWVLVVEEVVGWWGWWGWPGWFI